MNEIELPAAMSASGDKYIFRFDDDSLPTLGKVCREWVETCDLHMGEASMVLMGATEALARMRERALLQPKERIWI